MAPVTPLSRRSFLVRATGAGLLTAAGSAWLVACSDDGDDGHQAGGALTPVDQSAPTLITAFPVDGGYLVAGLEQRLTFQLATIGGAPITEVPDTLAFVVRREGDDEAKRIEVAAHRDGVSVPYYPLRMTFDETGVHRVEVDLGGGPEQQAFQVDARDAVALVQAGDAMPSVETPTTDDHRGVEPYCSAEPPCALHSETLTEALASGAPVALLIGSPAYCQGDTCQSALDLLVEQVDAHPGVHFVHAEVYRDAGTAQDLTQATVTPVVEAYGLSFEPCLLIADGAGTAVSRLDVIYDRAELAQALARVS